MKNIWTLTTYKRICHAPLYQLSLELGTVQCTIIKHLYHQFYKGLLPVPLNFTIIIDTILKMNKKFQKTNTYKELEAVITSIFHCCFYDYIKLFFSYHLSTKGNIEKV